MLATKGTLGRDRLGRHRLNRCRDVLSAALASDDNPLCTLRSGKHENHGRRMKSESHPQINNSRANLSRRFPESYSTITTTLTVWLATLADVRVTGMVYLPSGA
jgi:hypothetical protein